MMMVHFGKWKEILDLPRPLGCDDRNDKGCAKYSIAAATWHFGRAMAMAHLGRQDPEIEAEVKAFNAAQECVRKSGAGWGNNPADNILNVVRFRMYERIARRRGDATLPERRPPLSVPSAGAWLLASGGSPRAGRRADRPRRGRDGRARARGRD
jgi:hypothetical protein